jgi:hypothetical protein
MEGRVLEVHQRREDTMEKVVQIQPFPLHF